MEVDVLTLVSHGRTNSQIGADLYLSTETVKTHLSRVMRKLDSRDRAHAACTALRQGVIW